MSSNVFIKLRNLPVINLSIMRKTYNSSDLQQDHPIELNYVFNKFNNTNCLPYSRVDKPC